MRYASSVTTMRKRLEERRIADEANRIIQNLASACNYNTTAETKVFRKILLQTNGTILRMGMLVTIKGKSLGAGVYRISILEDEANK